jgi:MFS family permease
VSEATLTTTTRRRDWLHRHTPFLTPEVQRFFLGTLLSAMGTGLILSLFVIYCVDVRHFPRLETTAIMAWEALLGVSVAPLYGSLVDRYGPSRVLTVTMPLGALGMAAIGFASTVPMMALVATFFAVVGAGGWSAFTTLMTRLVPEAHRTDAFGINFLLLNLGIGLGIVAGTTVANTSDLRSFQVVYLMSAAFAMSAAVAWFTLRHLGGPADLDEAAREATAGEGWREVLRDRRMVRFTLTSLCVMVCGYGSVEAGLPYFIRNVRHLSVHLVGVVFLINTLTIVIGQLFALRAIRGRSRSLVLGTVGLCWGVSWLFATASVYVGTVAAVVALCLGQVIFATGETLWQPVAPALVNDLAPEHLRGRYNSLVGIVWGVSAAIGQLLVGVFPSGVAWTLFVAAGALAGGVGITTMRHVLTPEQDGRVGAVAR